MSLKRLLLSFCLVFAVFPTFAQQPVATTPVTKNPQGIAIMRTAVSAMAGSAQISDVTLTGQALRIVGSDVANGTFTLKALGANESRLDVTTSGGVQSELRNLSNGVPQGSWIGKDGAVGTIAAHNCLTQAVWFVPTLSLLDAISNPNISVAYIGSESKNGEAVQHVHFTLQYQASPESNQLIANLSGTDVYFSAASGLPIAVKFNIHPDSDAGTNIPVDIEFSNYQPMNGILMPFHVQKFVNGSLFLDLQVETVALNTGLNDSVFSSN
jgi:hypothetical protein